MPAVSKAALAGALVLGAAGAHGRELALAVSAVHAPQAEIRAVALTLRQQAGTASLAVRAAHVELPLLALSGRVDWSCVLERSGGTVGCSGPLQVVADDGRATSATLAARIGDGRVDVSFSRGEARVALSVPFADAQRTTALLRQVPVDWLRAPLAQVQTAGELRSGVLDADASWQSGGHVDGRFEARDLAFNTADGAAHGEHLVAAGHFEWQRAGGDGHLVVSTRFKGGTLQAGTLQVALPDDAVEAELDALLRANGDWDIARFHWRDAGTLEFEANAKLAPAAPAPLRALDLRIIRARWPGAMRYAGAVLADRGYPSLRLGGELAGEIVVDEGGLQRVDLHTPGLDIEDRPRRLSLGRLRGGVAWSARGTEPAASLAWNAARIAGLELGPATSRWQSRDGALHLLGALRVHVAGGAATLSQTILRPLPGHDERVDTAFALQGLGYDSADGTLAAAHVTARGRLRISSGDAGPRLRADADLQGGELLAGAVYVKLPSSPVRWSLDAAPAAGRWRVQRFAWNDPGVLELDGSADIEPGAAHPVHSLDIELHAAMLAPALERYAGSWLAAKGYAHLAAAGSVSGALRIDAAGLRRFAFAAHAVDLRDGDGRFAFDGVEGGVDWDLDTDMPATTLGWKSIELFRIPLGAARAGLESREAAIVLAQPLAIDVLGGRLRLEKLSLQPRSPRGERYAGSFALAGIEMAQLSAALGWPRFGGNLSGGVPEIEFSGDRIEFHGGLDLYVFDGHVGVSGMALERPFGVAPSLAADIHFENLDLDQVTSAFSFGGMSGRLAGTIGGLRLVDWSPVAFDAWLHTDGGGRMSYKAVDDITSIGGGGLSTGLQAMALKLFDTYGYRRLGIRCRLHDEVCMMGGIEPVPAAVAGAGGSSDAGYTIVEGSGLPRIMIVGHRRRVDWPTLVRRLLDATRGQGPVVR